MSDDFFDIINYLKIGDVDRGAKSQQLLGDLRDRAAYLTKKTGQEPVSWYEFQRQIPKEAPHSLRNLGIGALAGIAIGGLVGLVFPPVGIPLAISGAFAGGAIGAFTDTENTRRNGLVASYSNYLDQFEASLASAKAPALENAAARDDNAARLLAKQAQSGQGMSV